MVHSKDSSSLPHKFAKTQLNFNVGRQTRQPNESLNTKHRQTYNRKVLNGNRAHKQSPYRRNSEHKTPHNKAEMILPSHGYDININALVLLCN